MKTREQVQPAAAGKSAPTADPVGHYIWPSEFPVAVCGAISEWPTLRQAIEAGIGRPCCAECARLAPLGPMSRENPHGVQGLR